MGRVHGDTVFMPSVATRIFKVAYGKCLAPTLLSVGFDLLLCYSTIKVCPQATKNKTSNYTSHITHHNDDHTQNKTEGVSEYQRLNINLKLTSTVRAHDFLPVTLPVTLPITLSVCHSVTLSVCQSVSLSVCHSVTLSVCQSVSLSVCQSVSLSVYLNSYIIGMFPPKNGLLSSSCKSFWLPATASASASASTPRVDASSLKPAVAPFLLRNSTASL